MLEILVVDTPSLRGLLPSAAQADPQVEESSPLASAA
ncbi:hypothetical protein A2U01_0044221 [Trifolium medium]|uniref:Uncharacterized protein n=1 Tax=Trifolium medium TaxID=97028 RepID=A0A392QF84_9FABA|nr:hypothetical protein [Trifolium medium]